MLALATISAVLFVARVHAVAPQVVRELYSKNLRSTAKPRILPLPLKGKQLVSAGEYQMDGQHVTRIFRYSFKGDMDDFVSKAMPSLKGWIKDVMRDNVGNKQPGKGYTLTSPRYSRGPVWEQTLIVSPGRFKPDKTARFGSKKEPASGWISVSYNEDLP